MIKLVRIGSNCYNTIRVSNDDDKISQWITTKTGLHIPLNEDKVAIGGANGKLKGKRFKKSSNNSDNYKTNADPMVEYFGSATDEEIKKETEEYTKLGAKINWVESAEHLGYGPNPSGGVVGELSLSYNCSLSAVKHEMQHFYDDKKSGWRGMRILFLNIKEAVAWERRAYEVEIELAKTIEDEKTRNEMIERLEKNFEGRKKEIENRG